MVGKADIKLTTIGPTNVTKSLCRTLEAANIKVAESAEIITSQPRVCSESGAVAIVGMSGRFPGGADLKEFWDTLESGRDTAKKVSLGPRGSVKYHSLDFLGTKGSI